MPAVAKRSPPPDPAAVRKANGQWAKGFSGRSAYDAGRARRDLNADTIREMHAAFREGGRKAIRVVMKNNPAMFLKMLVLLVPRELQIEHSGGVKAMSDEQIEATIAAIEAIVARRAAQPGDDAKVVDGEVLRSDPALAAQAAAATAQLPENLERAAARRAKRAAYQRDYQRRRKAKAASDPG